MSEVVEIVREVCGVLVTLITLLGVPLVAYMTLRLHYKQTLLAKVNEKQTEKLEVLDEKVTALPRVVKSVEVVVDVSARKEDPHEALVPDPRPLVNPRQPPPPEPRREL